MSKSFAASSSKPGSTKKLASPDPAPAPQERDGAASGDSASQNRNDSGGKPKYMGVVVELPPLSPVRRYESCIKNQDLFDQNLARLLAIEKEIAVLKAKKINAETSSQELLSLDERIRNLTNESLELGDQTTFLIEGISISGDF